MPWQAFLPKELCGAVVVSGHGQASTGRLWMPGYPKAVQMVYNQEKWWWTRRRIMTKVCIVRCADYDRRNVEKAVEAMLTELDASALFRHGEKILLKPNMLSAKSPEQAVTTHPEILRGVAVTLARYGTALSYGDSPATDSPEKAARICGNQQVMDELSIPPADFRNSFVREYPEGDFARKFTFVKAVADNDGIVNVCKFKTHALTRFTGSLKNLFGLIPGFLKAKDHVRFPDETRFTYMLTDLNRCIGARLHVMDAVIGMEGNGPANGDPRAIGMILASTDPVALDSVCVGIMGCNYRTFPIITAGDQRGLGVADPSRIELSLIDDAGHPEAVRRAYASELLPELVVKDFRHAVDGHSGINMLNTPIGAFLKKAVINRPVVIPANCTKCRVCVKVCPVEPKAISFSEKNNRIEYRYERCIRCFCCQELCPHGAIKVEKAPLHFLLRAPHERKEKS
jgi:uncharacterized protein (DUF362 family)/Pyruvate/2-oxoacid:ferredoxin oxidoreductase delta subunit